MNFIVKCTKKVAALAIKNKPELLIVGGLIALGGGAIIAAVSGSHVHEVKEQFESDKQELENKKEEARERISRAEASECDYNEKDLEARQYLENGVKKDTVYLYGRTVFNYIKLFSISAGFVGLGIFLVLRGHNLLRGRYLKLAAAYISLQESYSIHRRKTAELIGTEKESEIFNETVKEQMEKSLTTNNSDSDITNPLYIPDDIYDRYCTIRFSKDNCPAVWRHDAASNLLFLKKVQTWVNDQFNANGFVDMNSLATGFFQIPPTDKWCVLGWVKDKNDPLRSNYIDFGLDPETNPDPELKAFLETAASSDPRNGTLEVTLRFNIDRSPIWCAMSDIPGVYSGKGII